MKKMKSYSESAEKARDDLSAKLDEARAEAQKNMADAEALLDSRQRLIDICTGAIQGSSSDAGNIVATYCNILNKPKPTAELIIQSLHTAAAHYGLSDDQAKKIAQAIMNHVTGNAAAGLIDWPDVDGWAAMLHNKALRFWAQTLNPDAYKKLESDEAAASKKHVEAELTMIRLDKARAALDEITVSDDNPENVLLRNNTERQVGIPGAGVAIDGGEVQALDFQTYAGLMGHQGFQKMKENGTLEVMT